MSGILRRFSVLPIIICFFSVPLTANAVEDAAPVVEKERQHKPSKQQYNHGKHHGKHHKKKRGLQVVKSNYSVQETMDRLESALNDRGLTVVARIDHAANASANGLELRPTQLIIFGNPNLGTPLMQSRQTVAIDLPQKMLVWEDKNAQVKLAYNKPRYLKQRHRLRGVGDTLKTISGALEGLAVQATGATKSD